MTYILYTIFFTHSSVTFWVLG